MDKKYYNTESLERSLRSFERRYGLSSKDVHESSVRGERIEGLSPRNRHMWMSLYVELCESGHDKFALSVERALAPAQHVVT